MYLFIAFFIAIVLMVCAISKWKVHPFLAILGVSLLLAIVLGIPLTRIPDVLGQGFAGVFTSIGLVIILGILIGAILEKTGAALTLANTIVKWVGKKHPETAMLLLGFVISIPVFCDSGFVITNPIKKALAARTGASPVAMTVCLAAGLYCSHVFIPPTPGPIAAAGALGVENQLIKLVLLGTLVSIPCLVAAYCYARWIGKRVHTQEETQEESSQEEATQEGRKLAQKDASQEGRKLAQEDAKRALETALCSSTNLPRGWAAAAPIVVPVLLMALGSLAALPSLGGAEGLLPTWAATALLFLGKPVIALTVGLLFALLLLRKKGIPFRSLTEDCLKTAGPILFITAAGAALGRVILEAGLVDAMNTVASGLPALGIFFPFLVAALLKSAQGSSTVAITTTAGLLGLYSDQGSLLSALGMSTPYLAVLTVLAIGAGAMTVSHANDSYFWVVTNFSGLTPTNGYKTQTAVTGIMGVVAVMVIWVLTL